jgi:integrase
MAKKGKLPDQECMNLEYVKMANHDTFESFLANIEHAIPQEALEQSIKKFECESDRIKLEIQKSLNILHSHSLLAAFLIWTKQYNIINGFPEYSRKLFNNKVIKFTDSNNKLLLIKNLDRKTLEKTIDDIRGQKYIELLEKEMLVTFYLDFMRWLRSVAFLYHLSVIDPDKQKTASRRLDYDLYIKLLTRLDERCQLVAKLLFFGGSRVLAEVLNLDIADVDFKRAAVRYDKIDTLYPLHILMDVKKLIEDRKKGKIFIGRNQTHLNAATVFRNFKMAASEIGLGDEFSPKMLTTDK